MEQFLCEPVELTEFELDAVAGGDPFGSATGNTTNSGTFNGSFFNATANGPGGEAEVTTVNLILSPRITSSTADILEAPWQHQVREPFFSVADLETGIRPSALGCFLPTAAAPGGSLCWRECPTATSLVNGEGGYVMEQILGEPVELTEFELGAVAGGNLFGSVFGNTTNSGTFSGAFFNATANGTGGEAEVSLVELVVVSHPSTSIVNVVNNSISVS
jgi:hypothetical protein